MIIDKPTALLSLRPNADFHMVGNTIIWQDLVQNQPTDAEIDAEVVRLNLAK